MFRIVAFIIASIGGPETLNFFFWHYINLSKMICNLNLKFAPLPLYFVLFVFVLFLYYMFCFVHGL